MLIGNGQLAKIFEDFKDNQDVCIFASGVANSNCTEEKEFMREKKLLLHTLQNNSGKKFVYFSSCAISSNEYKKNDYYIHKIAMEKLIKENSDNYFIFRLPQLFGCLKSHKTLINFIYTSIVEKKDFFVYSEAYRYIIAIDDVKKLVIAYLQYHQPNITVDLANPIQYKVRDIVNTLEEFLEIKANYTLIDKLDRYELNLQQLLEFINKNHLDINFSQNYLRDKLKELNPIILKNF